VIAQMICRKVSDNANGFRYVVLDADSFTQYGQIEYDVNSRCFTAKINSTERKTTFISEMQSDNMEDCLAWFRVNVRREDYRHTPWW